MTDIKKENLTLFQWLYQKSFNDDYKKHGSAFGKMLTILVNAARRKDLVISKEAHDDFAIALSETVKEMTCKHGHIATCLMCHHRSV